jgi:cytochrome c553
MPETPEQLDAMFSKLDDAQIARLAEFGNQRRAKAGEVLFDRGDTKSMASQTGRSPYFACWIAGTSPAK